LNKVLPLIAFSVLLLVPVGTNQAFAGLSSCTLTPNSVTLTLVKGASSDPISKVISCDSDILKFDGDASDCSNKRIDINFFNFQTPNPDEIDFDEIITNTGGAPGQTRCEMTFDIEFANGDPNVLLVQDIWVTTPQFPVGGEIIPLDTTMILLAGAQMNAAWLIPVIVSAVGIGIVLVRRK